MFKNLQLVNYVAYSRSSSSVLVAELPFHLQDPCRPEVRDAVELCKKAGVKVCTCDVFMPTGAWGLLE